MKLLSYEEEVIEFYSGKNYLGQIKIFPYVWFLSLDNFSEGKDFCYWIMDLSSLDH